MDPKSSIYKKTISPEIDGDRATLFINTAASEAELLGTGDRN